MGRKGPETWGRFTRPSEALVTKAQVNAEVNAQHADMVHQGFQRRANLNTSEQTRAKFAVKTSVSSCTF